MKASYQVVLTDNSIVVLFMSRLQTSIPLRHWSSVDGTTWSSVLRQGHQVDWLVGKLSDALNDASTDSTMQRVHRVLADPSMPPRLPPSPKPAADVSLAEVNGSSIAATRVPPMAPARLRRKQQSRAPHSPRATVGLGLNVSV